MRIAIIEDEVHASKRLEKLLTDFLPNLRIEARLDSVKSAVLYFETSPAPDLLFCDIQLADGLSFEIFQQTTIDCPIIFTTAYDQYAIQAFKVNAIDYLLKPIDPEELKLALQKFEKLHIKPSIDYRQIQALIQSQTKEFKSRFMVKVGEKISSIPILEVAYFFSEERITFLVTPSAKRHIVEYTLEQLEQVLDPKRFFRLNRKYITCIECVEEIFAHSNSRLKVKLKNCHDQDIIISREKVNEFKDWLNS